MQIKIKKKSTIFAVEEQKHEQKYYNIKIELKKKKYIKLIYYLV
jgi:hypothetical protein